MREERIICEIAAKTNLNNPKNAKAVYDLIKQKYSFNSQIGKLFLTRLEDLKDEKSGSDCCIACKKKRAFNGVFCEDCARSIREGKELEVKKSQHKNNNSKIKNKANLVLIVLSLIIGCYLGICEIKKDQQSSSIDAFDYTLYNTDYANSYITPEQYMECIKQKYGDGKLGKMTYVFRETTESTYPDCTVWEYVVHFEKIKDTNISLFINADSKEGNVLGMAFGFRLRFDDKVHSVEDFEKVATMEAMIYSVFVSETDGKQSEEDAKTVILGMKNSEPFFVGDYVLSKTTDYEIGVKVDWFQFNSYSLYQRVAEGHYS